MDFASAQELVIKLQLKIGDSKNIVIKRTVSVLSGEKDEETFSCCMRRVCFHPEQLTMLIEFARDNTRQMIVRIADPISSLDEKYVPASGKWELRNLVCVIY